MQPAGPATVGLIGFGALARQIVDALPATIGWVVLVRDVTACALPPRVRAVADLPELIAAAPDAVVEAAGQEAASAYVPDLLAAGIPVIVASVGALADPSLRARIVAARRASKTDIVLPSGAVGGLDYLAAVAALPDARVRYTSRKPPAAFAEMLAAHDLDGATGESVLFEGTADEAVRRYPKNLNVALSIALAAHPAPVEVRVVADPAATGNVHEIVVTSAAGTANLRFFNAPLPGNPKTSAITGLSIAATLRKLLQGVGKA
ncbi:DUF108 domain-containing protein [Rhizobium sp. TRM95111]|uniref:aspartate dehydrogenase domain-containing protein n=1 Tax=Rhizobium alarense TaxID=2846851 RepID=UPI001F20394A|nr:aspartate dehydrogenase domain-containing protein [Rhizobium alarense]MCF3639278.1 DUF108 domain-containing protein [Rhizobium alarense]